MRVIRIAQVIIAGFVLAGLADIASSDRASAQTSIAGNWSLTLIHPDIPGTTACSASIGQIDSALAASISCVGLGSGGFTGSITKPGGTFTLSGSLGGEATNLAGAAAVDGDSMSGTWTIAPTGHMGTFSGFRTSGSVGGIAVAPIANGPRDTSGGPSTLVIAIAAGLGLLALSSARLLASRQRRRAARLLHGAL